MKWNSLLILAQIAFSTPVMAALPPLPQTPQRPVFDEYHGTKIVDPYQWLEKDNEADVKKWTEQQATYADQYLQSLPYRNEIKARLQEWADFKSPIYRAVFQRAGLFFALKVQPGKVRPLLVVLDSLENTKNERVVIDPNALGSATVIDWFSVSFDGKYVGASLSENGSEIGTLSVFQVKDGKRLPDQIPHVQKPTAGGGMTWNAASSGFYYTRYPHPGEKPKDDLEFYQQVYFHRLGSSVKDDNYVTGKDFPRIAEVSFQSSPDGRYHVISVANGDGGEHEHHLLTPDGQVTQITRFKDKVISSAFGRNGELYLLSRDGAPRGKILRLAAAQADLTKAKVFVKEGEGVVEEILPTENYVFVSYLNGGPSEIKYFSNAGKLEGTIPTPAQVNVGNLDVVKGDQMFFRLQSYVQPAAFYTFEPVKKGKASPQITALVTQSPVDFSDIEAKKEVVRSKDGTKVPMTILSRKGLKRDKSTPAILYGYGGYGWSLTPSFRPSLHLWLERGGIFIYANIRGGGEFGEKWHLAGNLTKKQNVFDDFIACAQYLIDAKYTSRDRLAIEGRSNGGLLVAAVMTQRPDLFRAVVSAVGIYDMVRVENDANGAFNVTEFGSVKDPAQFKSIYAYSPYHRVKDSTNYPAVLLMTGANDGRVSPYHSKKMAARLQAASTSSLPVLLRVSFGDGHGVDRSISQKVDDDTDQYAFLFSQLGVKF